MAGLRAQANSQVNGLSSTRVAQDTPVPVNQEVCQMQPLFFAVQRVFPGRLAVTARCGLRLPASTRR
jgi:hypothetical protein